MVKYKNKKLFYRLLLNIFNKKILLKKKNIKPYKFFVRPKVKNKIFAYVKSKDLFLTVVSNNLRYLYWISFLPYKFYRVLKLETKKYRQFIFSYIQTKKPFLFSQYIFLDRANKLNNKYIFQSERSFGLYYQLINIRQRSSTCWKVKNSFFSISLKKFFFYLIFNYITYYDIRQILRRKKKVHNIRKKRIRYTKPKRFFQENQSVRLNILLRVFSLFLNKRTNKMSIRKHIENEICNIYFNNHTSKFVHLLTSFIRISHSNKYFRWSNRV